MTSIKSILRTPGRRRETFLRRSLALSLVILALALAVFPRTESTTEVLRYATAVEAGTAVNRTHFTTAHVPQHLIPENALRPDDLLSSDPNERITISAHTAGSIATAVDFLDSSHTLSSVGNQLPFGEDKPINIVPIRLAEQSVSRVLHPGDVVDVIAANDAHDPHVVAAGGVIVFAPVPEKNTSSYGSDAVLIALPADQARIVASQSLAIPLTVVIAGARARPPKTK
ncbi:hypothetical protein [Corynebacterium diphtheriae]|uniref:hypothetical protein n=1 Tax=Corynebacterium diphtheriae TaxID=1717 RepID=UPI000B4AAB3A|nr:hypothetical protein [Corynebacterium diphtheriae]OWN55887.1 hypothetical protein AY500_01415 [Corynebacterium diphtheriae bv. gravis]OWO12880.1 hypothetical protein AY537_01540 [Corynebacterium diphtheriae bv. gravis]OWO31507.1 hypothetical protein AY538_00345 [Corynebacterium diphtheriae bv. gravis]OWO63836.1 hypothetical protein AY548_00340 [Corynebacterium diphtheriae bv. gravis]